MKEFSIYLDQVKVRLNIQTDRELSEKLGIHKNHLVYIRKGATFPSDDLCLKIVELTGDDPAPILALAHKLRATSPKTRKVWERIEKALAASVAACILVAFFITTSYTYQPILKVSPQVFSPATYANISYPTLGKVCKTFEPLAKVPILSFPQRF